LKQQLGKKARSLLNHAKQVVLIGIQSVRDQAESLCLVQGARRSGAGAQPIAGPRLLDASTTPSVQIVTISRAIGISRRSKLRQTLVQSQ
jgi:hypothetical protein